MIFGRTNLIIGQSKAKNCKESAGDVGIDVAPQKPSENVKTHVFETKKLRKQNKKSLKNKMSVIVRNAFSQSFVAIGADFEG